MNKSDNAKVNFAIRQVVHKADLYCYLSDLTKTIENELLPEINALKELETGDTGKSFRDCNTRMSHMNEIVDSVSIFFMTFIVHILCIDLNVVRKFITDFRFTIIV